MKKIIISIMSLLITKFTYADILQTSNGNNKLTINCNANGSCLLKASNGKKDFSLKGQYLYSDNRSVVNWHGQNLIELTQGNGSENAITAFFDFESMQYKGGFYNVVFVDPTTTTVIAEDNAGNNFVMECIFNQNIKPKVVFNDTSYGALDWDSFTYVNDKEIKFGYYDDKNNYHYKTVNLDLKCD